MLYTVTASLRCSTRPTQCQSKPIYQKESHAHIEDKINRNYYPLGAWFLKEAVLSDT